MSRKTHSFAHAEDIIRAYPENRKLLDEIKERREAIIYSTPNRPEIPISGKYKPHDLVVSKAVKLVDESASRHLRDAVYSVECALEDVRTDPRKDAILKIIDLYYWQRTHTILGAAKEAGYSERQGRRIKNMFVFAVKSYLGW